MIGFSKHYGRTVCSLLPKKSAFQFLRADDPGVRSEWTKKTMNITMYCEQNSFAAYAP
jgi:hypothetical protein